ncbi:MAG TPA: PqqD family protein [Rickettsiales bacterium]|nr:PqqD family protein [Rickettsiales bacterium]
MPLIDSKKVLWKEVDGLVVVLLISAGYFIELNKVGSTIWKLLAEGKSVEEIVAAMMKIYDVAAEKLTADVKAFIERMAEQGLVQA